MSEWISWPEGSPEECPVHGPVETVGLGWQRRVRSARALLEADPHGVPQHEPGAKLDAGKLRAWLCVAGFSNALVAVADVTTKGAAKYTPNGWAKVANGSERYMDAFGRHMLALGRGESLDSDTGCLHKAQMIWNLLASLELEIREANEPQQAT